MISFCNIIDRMKLALHFSSIFWCTFKEKCPLIYPKIYPIVNKKSDPEIWSIYNTFVDPTNTHCENHFSTCLSLAISSIATRYRIIENRKLMDVYLREWMPNYSSMNDLSSSSVLRRYKNATDVGMYVCLKVNAKRIYREEMLCRALKYCSISLEKEKYMVEALEMYDKFVSGEDPIPSLVNNPSSSSAFNKRYTHEIPDSDLLWRTARLIGSFEGIRMKRRLKIINYLINERMDYSFIYELTFYDSLVPFEEGLHNEFQELLFAVK